MNVSSVKNLNGETFSAVQDATLTNVVQTNSSNWDKVTNKLDTTSFSDVSGSFLTAVDLSNYYTKSQTSGASEIADALSNIPTGNPEVENYVQSNSAQIDETVTSFQTNSSTYMVEPNLEYNAVNEISGYNGSAIAQYGAEKQWLVHDDTIVHISNSAQYALGVNVSALQRLMGVDETVLYDGGSMFWFNNTATVFTASDNFSNYNRIKLITRDDWEIAPQEQEFPGTNSIWNVAVQGYEGDKYVIKAARLSANGNQISFLKANTVMISSAGEITANTAVPYIVVSGIIGIGRKS